MANRKAKRTTPQRKPLMVWKDQATLDAAKARRDAALYAELKAALEAPVDLELLQLVEKALKS